MSREECYKCINGSCIIHLDKPNNSKHDEDCIIVEQPDHQAVQNQPDQTNNPEEPNLHLNDDDLESESNKENIPLANQCEDSVVLKQEAVESTETSIHDQVTTEPLATTLDSSEATQPPANSQTSANFLPLLDTQDSAASEATQPPEKSQTSAKFLPQLDTQDSAASEVTQQPESSEKSQPVLNSLVEDHHNIKHLLQDDVTKVTNSLQKMQENLMCYCQELSEIATDSVNIQESGVSKENATELANFISSCGLEINKLGQHLINVSGEIKAKYMLNTDNKNTHNQVKYASAPSASSAANPNAETSSAANQDVERQSEKCKRKANGNYVYALCSKEFHLRPPWYNHMKIHKNITHVCSLEYCDYFCKSESTF